MTSQRGIFALENSTQPRQTARKTIACGQSWSVKSHWAPSGGINAGFRRARAGVVHIPSFMAARGAPATQNMRSATTASGARSPSSGNVFGIAKRPPPRCAPIARSARPATRRMAAAKMVGPTVALGPAKGANRTARTRCATPANAAFGDALRPWPCPRSAPLPPEPKRNPPQRPTSWLILRQMPHPTAADAIWAASIAAPHPAMDAVVATAHRPAAKISLPERHVTHGSVACREPLTRPMSMANTVQEARRRPTEDPR